MKLAELHTSGPLQESLGRPLVVVGQQKPANGSDLVGWTKWGRMGKDEACGRQELVTPNMG